MGAPWSPACQNYIADFVQEGPIKTIRGTVTTSVGTTVQSKLTPELLQRIQTVREARAAALAGKP